MTKKLVYGVGINDAGYLTQVNSNVGGCQTFVWICPFYCIWRGMLERCYSERLLAKRPTYTGCAVVPEWHRFSTFRLWMEQQPWEGNQLDKDILVPGNKVYGPDTCVFVPQQLNTFLTGSNATRGEWPVGVCWNKYHEKFAAACSNPWKGKNEHLGYFDSPEAAHLIWKKRKHELACKHADMQVDSRIAEALRTRYL